MFSNFTLGAEMIIRPMTREEQAAHRGAEDARARRLAPLMERLRWTTVGPLHPAIDGFVADCGVAKLTNALDAEHFVLARSKP